MALRCERVSGSMLFSVYFRWQTNQMKRRCDAHKLPRMQTRQHAMSCRKYLAATVSTPCAETVPCASSNLLHSQAAHECQSQPAVRQQGISRCSQACARQAVDHHVFNLSARLAWSLWMLRRQQLQSLESIRIQAALAHCTCTQDLSLSSSRSALMAATC